jgi:O-antigen ligase
VGPRFAEYLPPGAGGSIPKEWYYQHLHNIYFHFGAERGLPALAALLWMMGQALADFLGALRRVPAESGARWVLHGAVAVIVAVLAAGWGEVNLGDSEVLAMFLAVMACGYAAAAEALPLTAAGARPISRPWNRVLRRRDSAPANT